MAESLRVQLALGLLGGIALPAMLLAIVIGTAVGLYAAVHHDRTGDQVVRLGTLVGRHYSLSPVPHTPRTR